MIRTSSFILLLGALTAYAPNNFAEGRNYAVYYDPDDDDRNPKGEGWTPKGPKDWGDVMYYGDFYDWKSNSNAKIGRNMCRSDTLFKPDYSNIDEGWNEEYESGDGHRQSPIVLEGSPWWKCNARHGMPTKEGSKCNVDFRITPYGLRAEFNCDQQPFLDMSRASADWELMYIEIKTRSEHVVAKRSNDQNLSKPKDSIRRDAEIIFAHRGLLHHDREVAFISALVDSRKSERYHSKELQRYIDGWKKEQESRYRKCNLRYNKQECSVEKDNRVLKETDMDMEDNDIRRELKRWNRDPYELITDKLFDEYYYQYEGSLTVPPCSEVAEWNILKEKLKVSSKQLEEIDELIYMHLDRECNLATVGEKRYSDSCEVDTYRPLHYQAKKQHLVKCSEWVYDP